MKVLFWVVLILFSLVRTKIVHYSSMCYFPLTFLGALSIYELNGHSKKSKLVTVGTLVIGCVSALLIIAIPFIDRYKHEIIGKGWIKDAFAVEALKANVHWSGWEFLIGLLLLISTVYFVLTFRNNRRLAMYTLLIVNVVVLNLIATVYLPKIEQYSQGAAIDFYKSKQGVDCHILAVGFKSYADYFYAQKRPPKDANIDEQWLVNGDHKHPVFIVSKVTKKEKLKLHYPQFELIGEKNGYTFYQRMNQ
jgi:hypothetical protein